MELKNIGRARQLQDVDGVSALGRRHNGHIGIHVAGGENDVGITHVAVQSHQHGGFGQAQIAVHLAGVMFAHHRLIPLVQHLQGRLAVMTEQHAPGAVIFQIIHQVEGNGTGADHNDMAPGIRRNGAGRVSFFLSLQPGSVKKLDERKGQHDQKQQHPGHEHHYGEHPSQIRGEGNVAETQGGHDRQCPVYASHPGKTAVLILHDVVEKYAVDDDETQQHGEEAQQEAHIPAYTVLLHEKGDLCRKKFHGGSGVKVNDADGCPARALYSLS